jgi:hypothetical protein
VGLSGADDEQAEERDRGDDPADCDGAPEHRRRLLRPLS